MVLVEKLTRFSEETSVHGVSYIGRSTSSNGKRLLWLFLFIGALTYAGLQIKTIVECKKCFTLCEIDVICKTKHLSNFFDIWFKCER